MTQVKIELANAIAIEEIFKILRMINQRVEAIESFLCSECNKDSHDHH